MAQYYSQVPVRADKGYEPLDLMRSEWVRLARTDSLK
jgi:hypothetical protein